jgi:hypothetical protein
MFRRICFKMYKIIIKSVKKYIIEYVDGLTTQKIIRAGEMEILRHLSR